MAVAYVIWAVVLPLAWELLSFQVPGFSFSAKTFVVALFLMHLGVTVSHLALGVGNQRSGHSSRHRISQERKNDEK